MLVSLPRESYGAELRAFFATHKPVPERPHHYVKDAIVRAKRVDQPTDIVTVLDGREEMRATVETGGWVIQNPAGESTATPTKSSKKPTSSWRTTPVSERAGTRTRPTAQPPLVTEIVIKLE